MAGRCQAVLAHLHRRARRQRVHHLPVRRDVPVAAAVAEAADLTEHDVRLALALLLVPHPEPVERVAGVAVKEDVRGGEQPPEDLLPRGRVEVQRHAALVLVDLHVGGAVVRRDLAKEVTQVVTLERALYLDDIGAQIAEQRPHVVAVEQRRRLQNADAFQLLQHGLPPCRWVADRNKYKLRNINR